MNLIHNNSDSPNRLLLAVLVALLCSTARDELLQKELMNAHMFAVANFIVGRKLVYYLKIGFSVI